MPNLYAWNTARAGFVAYPNVREARLFHPTKGRQFFGLFDKPLLQQENAPGRIFLLGERAAFRSNP
uniref:Uncharacterized protein n=1 Tax=Candidatus Kentrum sp. FM TaxID=2126340 RepID=A0A450THW5_9GAMM|nr:MAG: hypothetical protein BECKFM1743A_GA0114220_104274 [Candidatus Kentron sp. FM]VFJ67203.1 MAG: hypothetical protein BECKFM1743C_GA0114222_104474 [Candidatus Kentron sp. FM]VFK16765.1 MAG: hypothetical protein BECKFM1743B_GA0114221_104414 [Candidatus Kentron sp. FM]